MVENVDSSLIFYREIFVRNICKKWNLFKGGLDVESFQNDFTSNLPTIRVFSSKDVSEHLQKVRDVISDDKKDWEIRVKAVSMMSSEQVTSSKFCVVEATKRACRRRRFGTWNIFYRVTNTRIIVTAQYSRFTFSSCSRNLCDSRVSWSLGNDIISWWRIFEDFCRSNWRINLKD